jgi:hypothetical protein
MKVAIVAQGESWRGVRQAEVDEVWAINMMVCRIRHDVAFAMDDLALQQERAKTNDSVRSLLEMLEIHPEFFTSTVYPAYEGARAFPLQAVVNSVGTTYLNSTVAHAVAYAIHAGVQELHLYGCDFSYPHAHKAEAGRGCVEHLLGIAKERGIRVVLPPDTTLMDQCVPDDAKPYGYDAHHVTFTETEGEVRVAMTPKALPHAHEIEARYEQ